MSLFEIKNQLSIDFRTYCINVILYFSAIPIILTSSPIKTFAKIQTDTSASITFYSNRRNNIVECSRNSTKIYCGWFLEDVDISLPVIDSIVQTKGWTAKVILSIQDNNDLGTFTVTISNDVGSSTIDVNVLNSGLCSIHELKREQYNLRV